MHPSARGGIESTALVEEHRQMLLHEEAAAMLELRALQDKPRREVAMLQRRAAHHRRWAARLRAHLIATEQRCPR
jgi:hypothetical protein